MIEKTLKRIIKFEINCKLIHIYNESSKHKLQYSNHSHFSIVIVSDDFLKLNLLMRHRKIYLLLSKYISYYKIWGISLFTYTIIEWEKNNNKKINYPKCNR